MPSPGFIPKKSVRVDFPWRYLPPLLQKVLQEVATVVQPPVELAFASALGVLSIACQGSRRVKVPIGYTCNIGVYLLTIAGSGVRKSSTDRPFMAPVRAFQTECDADLAKRTRDFERDRRIWDSERKGLERAISKARATDKPIADIEKKMAELYEREPQKPKGYKLIVEDATPAAFARILADSHPTTGIFSDEGGTVLNAPVLRSLEMLNKAWSGDAINIDRVTTGSSLSERTNLTLSLMAQPRVVDNFLGKANNHARESGFVSRCLVARPHFEPGYRDLRPGVQYSEGMEEWTRRITQLLRENHPLESPPAAPQTLQFSPIAAEEWTAFAQRTETFQQKGEMFFDIPDAASKMAENAARISALFHCLGSDTLEIGHDSVVAATWVCDFYLREFHAIFKEKENDDDELHAQNITEWLHARCEIDGRKPYISVRKILQLGPSPRNVNARDRALDLMAQKGMVRIVRKRSQINLWLNPSKFKVDLVEGAPNNGFPKDAAYVPWF